MLKLIILIIIASIIFYLCDKYLLKVIKFLKDLYKLDFSKKKGDEK